MAIIGRATLILKLNDLQVDTLPALPPYEGGRDLAIIGGAPRWKEEKTLEPARH